MTEYLIFKKDPGANPGQWQEKAREYAIKASSAKRALQAAELEEGTYVAVPARSWKPLTVKVEQTTKVTIS